MLIITFMMCVQSSWRTLGAHDGHEVVRKISIALEVLFGPRCVSFLIQEPWHFILWAFISRVLIAFWIGISSLGDPNSIRKENVNSELHNVPLILPAYFVDFRMRNIPPPATTVCISKHIFFYNVHFTTSSFQIEIIVVKWSQCSSSLLWCVYSNWSLHSGI